MRPSPADLNRIRLHGRLEAAPVFSHENHGVAFYLFPLAVARLSGVEDRLHVVLPDGLLPQLGPPVLGQEVTVTGEVRTFNNRSGPGSKLVISTFARSILPCSGPDENRLELTGTLCKPPALRSTPLGRTICDMILAVQPGGLSPLHRLGQSGPPVRQPVGGGPGAAHRAAAKPPVQQDHRGPPRGAHRL